MFDTPFKWGGFYGLTAPYLLVLSKEEIDKLFGNPLTPTWGTRLQYLQWELEKLQQLLSDPKAIHTVVDTESYLASVFKSGLNVALADNQPIDLSNLDVVDLGSTDTNTADTDDVDPFASEPDPFAGDVSEGNTSMFGSSTVNLPDTLASQSVNDIDPFADPVSDDIDPFANHSEDADIDPFAIDESSEDPFSAVEIQNDVVPVTDIFDTNESAWTLPDNLIAIGSQNPDAKGRFSSFTEVYRWFLSDALAELGKDNFDILSKQIEKLPRKLSGRCVLNGKTINLSKDYPQLYAVVSELVKQANTSWDTSTKLQYILSKVTDLVKNSNNSTVSYFGVKYDIIRSARGVWGCNERLNKVIVSQLQSVRDQGSFYQIVESMLKDCDALLGVSQSQINYSTAQRELKALTSVEVTSCIEVLSRNRILKDLDLTDPDTQKALMYVIDSIISRNGNVDSKNKFEPVAARINDIYFLTQMYLIANRLDSEGPKIFGVADLGVTPRGMTELGLDIAKKFKICGIYFGVFTKYRSDVGMSSVLDSTDRSFEEPQNDDDYEQSVHTNLKLVRAYLKSILQRRNLGNLVGGE